MNKIAKNYLYNLLYQILLIIVPLITTPYISRVLGVKGIGIHSYTNSIVQYFILLGCIGLNLYGQREVAYVQTDEHKRSKVFWELVILRIITVSISLIVFYATFVTHGPYSSIFFVMSIDIIASMIDISWFFEGIEDFKKIAVRNFITKLIGVALIFLLVKTSEDLLMYVFCYSSTILLGNLSMWIYIPKLVSRIHIKDLSVKNHLKPAIILFLPQIATSVYTVFDKTMIGFLSGVEEEVAYYEQAQKIVKLIMTLVTSLGTVMMPRIASLYRQNDIKKLNNYLYMSFKFVFLVASPMTLGLMAISVNFVPWFFGPGYDKVIPNLMLLAPILMIISLSTIIGVQYLLPIGRQKEYTLSVMTGCAINFIMNLLLIPNFLSLGAATATVFAESAVTMVQIISTRKDFNYTKIFRKNINYMISALVMFFIVCLLARYLESNIINTLICMIVGSLIYFLLLFIEKDDIILTLCEKIRIHSI